MPDAADPRGAMEAFDIEKGRGDVALHEHAICIFDNEPELGRVLAGFVRAGVQKDELSVFVHSFATDDDAWRFLEHAYGQGGPPRRDIVLVSLYTQAFQGMHPRIDHAHVTQVIGSIVERATDGGHQGARIFVDASRRYLAQERAEEWFAFESWLGRRLQANVGLVCAYRREDVIDPANTARILQTHAYRFAA